MKKFTFRSASGRTCCSADDINLLCAKCRARAGATPDAPVTRTMRASAPPASDAQNFDPPDAYAAGLKALRADYSGAPAPVAPRDARDFAPPDSYAAGLKAMRDAAREGSTR